MQPLMTTEWVICFLSCVCWNCYPNLVFNLFLRFKMKQNSEHAGISAIRELVHSFLLDLCSSRKHGISFHDASFGTAGRWVISVASLLCTLLESPLADHRILLFLTEPATLSCSSSWWVWSRPQRMNWWRSWWWMCWKSALTFWPDTFRRLSIHTHPASKVLGRTMSSYLKRWETSFGSYLLLASSILSFSENNYLIWIHMSDLWGPARGFHSLPNFWCHPSPSPALHD